MYIEKFNLDGILDRQQVSQRTIDFIDDRFVYLSQDLDSIETGKEYYKKANELAFLEADANLTLRLKSEAASDVNKIETQIYLTKSLKETVEKQNIDSLLPMDV